MIVIVFSPGAAGSTTTPACRLPSCTEPTKGCGAVPVVVSAASVASVAAAAIPSSVAAGRVLMSTEVTATMATMIPSSAPRDPEEAPPLRRGGDAGFEARHRVAVVVGAEGDEREDERDLREQQQPIRGLPQPSPGPNLEIGGDDPGRDQRHDRVDGQRGEPGHRPGGELPPILAGEDECEHEEGEAARPQGRGDHVDDVGDEAEAAQPAGVDRTTPASATARLRARASGPR